MRMIVAALVALSIAGAAVAADTVIPDRLADAKPNEWVLMQEVGGPNAGDRVKFTVVETRGSDDEAVIVLRQERTASDGEAVEPRTIEVPLGRYRTRIGELEAKAKQISRERLKVKDKEVTVYAVSWDDDEDGETPHEFKIWLSSEIPVGGIVKSWSSDPDFPAAELVDFGF